MVNWSQEKAKNVIHVTWSHRAGNVQDLARSLLAAYAKKQVNGYTRALKSKRIRPTRSISSCSCVLWRSRSPVFYRHDTNLSNERNGKTISPLEQHGRSRDVRSEYEWQNLFTRLNEASICNSCVLEFPAWFLFQIVSNWIPGLTDVCTFIIPVYRFWTELPNLLQTASQSF